MVLSMTNVKLLLNLVSIVCDENLIHKVLKNDDLNLNRDSTDDYSKITIRYLKENCTKTTNGRMTKRFVRY